MTKQKTDYSIFRTGAAIFVAAVFGALNVITTEARATPAGQSLISGFEQTDAGPVFVVAHRGCWSAAPENSVASIEACKAIGVRAVEIDVQMTRDGHLIVFHDSTLKRMTNGWGYVADHTLAQLRELKLYERDGSPAQQFNRPLLTDMPVSTLEEVFEAARGSVMINLEIKTNNAAGFSATFAAATALAKRMEIADQVFWKIPPSVRGIADDGIPADRIYNTINTEGLRYIMPIIWQSQRPFTDQLEDFADTDVRYFEIVAHDLPYWPVGEDGRIIGSDKNRYMIVGVLPRWSAGLSDDVALSEPDAVWGQMLSLGADVIMTDRPEQLLAYLHSRGLRP